MDTCLRKQLFQEGGEARWRSNWLSREWAGFDGQPLTGTIDTTDTLEQVGRRGRDGLVEEGGPSVECA